MAAIQLRKGKTHDARLDRIRRFDARSRKFPIGALLAAAAPRSYSWRCDAYLDQGAEGACVGFGISHELLARPAEAGANVVTAKYARESLYWEAQRTDEWDGGSYPGARPFYEGTSVLAGVKVAHGLGWFESYRWAFSFEEFLAGVSRHGPAVIGVDWHRGMMQPDAGGWIHRTGPVEGGHCTLVQAINVREQSLTIHNSWGRGWGRGGRAKISWDDMRALLSAGGEAVFFVGRRSHPKAVTR